VEFKHAVVDVLAVSEMVDLACNGCRPSVTLANVQFWRAALKSLPWELVSASAAASAAAAAAADEITRQSGAGTAREIRLRRQMTSATYLVA